MILKMMLIVFGIFLLILDLFMYARQKLTDGIGLGWAIVSATFLVSGIAVSTDAATYLWNQTVPHFLLHSTGCLLYTSPSPRDTR